MQQADECERIFSLFLFLEVFLSTMAHCQWALNLIAGLWDPIKGYGDMGSQSSDFVLLQQ